MENGKSPKDLESKTVGKIAQRTFEFVYWGLSAVVLLFLIVSAFAWGIFPLFYMFNSLFG